MVTRRRIVKEVNKRPGVSDADLWEPKGVPAEVVVVVDTNLDYGVLADVHEVVHYHKPAGVVAHIIDPHLKYVDVVYYVPSFWARLKWLFSSPELPRVRVFERDKDKDG